VEQRAALVLRAVEDNGHLSFGLPGWLSLRLVQSWAVEPGDWIAPGNAKLHVVRKAERCNWSRNRVGLDATPLS